MVIGGNHLVVHWESFIAEIYLPTDERCHSGVKGAQRRSKARLTALTNSFAATAVLCPAHRLK
jgi:hypothetical protein